MVGIRKAQELSAVEAAKEMENIVEANEKAKDEKEKLRLIEADLSEHQCFINELDEHVNFLRDTSKNLESINYSVKAKIELANILGGYK